MAKCTVGKRQKTYSLDDREGGLGRDLKADKAEREQGLNLSLGLGNRSTPSR